MSGSRYGSGAVGDRGLGGLGDRSDSRAVWAAGQLRTRLPNCCLDLLCVHKGRECSFILFPQTLCTGVHHTLNPGAEAFAKETKMGEHSLVASETDGPRMECTSPTGDR